MRKLSDEGRRDDGANARRKEGRRTRSALFASALTGFPVASRKITSEPTRQGIAASHAMHGLRD